MLEATVVYTPLYSLPPTLVSLHKKNDNLSKKTQDIGELA
jgi:hypothetical protein